MEKKTKTKKQDLHHVLVLFPELPPPVMTKDGELVLNRSLEHQGIIVFLKDASNRKEAVAAFRMVRIFPTPFDCMFHPKPEISQLVAI